MNAMSMYQQRGHHLRTGEKCRISDSTPDPLTQNLYLKKVPRGFMGILSFEKHGAKAHAHLRRLVTY